MASIMRNHCRVLLVFAAAVMATAANADTVTESFAVTATIENGCVLGSDSSSSTDDLGTIDFGTLAATNTNVDVTSSDLAGSIILTCTPGMSVAISLDYGLGESASSSVRYLTLDDESLPYQLYQDSSRSTVWGLADDGLQLSISSFPETTTSYPVYARLIAVDSLPSAGVYVDTVTVIVAY
jgi:spore coat protein U-like protein